MTRTGSQGCNPVSFQSEQGKQKEQQKEEQEEKLQGSETEKKRGQRGYHEHKMPGERGEKGGPRRWREGYAAAAGRKAGSQLAVLTQARVAGLHSPAAFE